MNLKRLLAGVLACCVIGGTLPTFGEVADNAVITVSAADDDEYTEGTYESLKYLNYGDNIEISGCDESATSVVIPAEIDGLPVTSIGDSALRDCTSLESITIPDSVTSIGRMAFAGCSALISITIPDSVTIIGNYGFAGCEKLTSVTIPDSVISIDEAVFFYCTSLESITIPDSVTGIGYSAFEGCSALISITIPDSVTIIADGAFGSCTKLTEITILNPNCEISDNEYIISNGYDETVGNYFNGTIYGYDNSTAQKYAEKYNRKFVSLSEPTPEPTEGTYEQLKYTNYGDHIEITGCEEDATEVVIPAEIDGLPVTSFGFSMCFSLTSVTIPNSVTIIKNGAFYYCGALTSVTIPDSVTSIEEYAFFDAGLTSIIIPESVTSIGDCAFLGCFNLTSVTILNPECEIYDSSSTIGNEFNGDYSGTIYGYDNSTAQTYAEKYGKKFVSLGAAPEKATEMGDIDGDGKIDSSDASFVLTEYSLLSTGKEGNLSDSVKKLADLNKDGTIDSSDASLILAYYSYTATGGKDTIDVFLEKQEY